MGDNRVPNGAQVASNAREIAGAVIFDTLGRLLLQLRDDVPGILYPGKITLFGGHREGGETFLECAVREIQEELSFFIPPERFEPIAQRGGPDNEFPGGIVHVGIFVTRDVPVDKLFVTEGRLKIVRGRELGEIAGELTPSALFGIRLCPSSSDGSK
jgi:8-oxo-dGTP diphosphatase